MKNLYLLKICCFIYLFIAFKPLQAQEKKAQIKREEITTTWNGATWSNGLPAKEIKAIFASNYSTTENFTANSVEIINQLFL